MATHAMLTLLVLGAMCAGCAPLTDHVEPVGSTAYTAPLATQLGRTASSAAAAHSSESGFLVLDTGTDALIERVSLIEAAEQSIDLQYYIWNSDVTGRYLASCVYAAAERGVQVRILLDDFNVGERDAVLAALDAHSRIEVRLYNPLARGSARRSLGMIREFSRVNRRMHNKSLTADGAATIIGGRNIGDEYFDASHELNFRDRDLLAIGSVVEQMGRAFDEFWNSERAQPIGAIATEQLSAADWERRREQAAEQLATLKQLHYELPRDAPSALARFTARLEQLVWAPARLVVDDPATAEGSQTTAPQPVALALRELAAAAEHDVLIESAYLIPGDAALELLATLHGRGVRLRALTNSLASNDLATNHSGYARRRKQMLLAGVELHELRPDAASCATLTPDRCAARRRIRTALQVRGVRPSHRFRRFIQRESALGVPQYRNGIDHRKPCARAASRRCHRAESASREQLGGRPG